jgi:hypothetical protein
MDAGSRRLLIREESCRVQIDMASTRYCSWVGWCRAAVQEELIRVELEQMRLKQGGRRA